MNLDSENKVILNVGGIRHETYKVSLNFFFFFCYYFFNFDLKPLYFVFCVELEQVGLFICTFSKGFKLNQAFVN